MTRVVVQRGSGPANSSRPPSSAAPPSSALPSVPASSSPQVPSPSEAQSHPLAFCLSGGDEGPERIAKEVESFNDVEILQTLVADNICNEAFESSSSLLDARGEEDNDDVNLEAKVHYAGALDVHGSEDLQEDLKEPEFISHLQFAPERLQEVTDLLGQHLKVGDDIARTAEVVAKVSVDGEEGVNSFEKLSLRSEDLTAPFTTASTGQSKQEDSVIVPSSIPQGEYSSGQNAILSPSPTLASSGFGPLSVPVPCPPSQVQSVMHTPALPPLSGYSSPSLSGGAHTFLRSHEENDWGRSMGNPNVSEAIGCSYLSAPPSSVPFLPSSSSRRSGLVGPSSVSSGTRGGVTYRRVPRAVKGSRNSPNSSRPTSPRTYGEGDGYNSADEQGPWSSGPPGYEDSAERECQFENELRCVKSLEVRRMAEDGNCLFRAVADQVYGDAEMYSETRQLCIDYMEKERDHFSHFVTESFTAYCKRKRRDKVYGNNLEIQAMAEMYNRPIHIYSYTTEPINIFHGSYETDLPPIRLSYHRSNHYNSLLDPCNPAVGAGLGFGSLCGVGNSLVFHYLQEALNNFFKVHADVLSPSRERNVDTEQVKAALKAQQEQQIDKALIAEGRFYSDMELTEQEIEHMVMEASRAEFLAVENSRLHFPWQEETSTSAGAEPSSSGTSYVAARSPRTPSGVHSGSRQTIARAGSNPATSTGGAEGTVSSNVRTLLSMGFSYLRVMEAHSIFSDNISNMLCYLMETNGCSDGESISRRKGKAAE